MAKKSRLTMAEINPAQVPDGECPHCMTDGLHEHSKRCPTLDGLTEQEREWALASFEQRERMTPAATPTRRTSTTGPLTMPGNSLAATLHQRAAIEGSQAERQEALRIAGGGLDALRAYAEETERRQRVGAQAADLLGITE